jgi:hypothetical protein
MATDDEIYKRAVVITSLTESGLITDKLTDEEVALLVDAVIFCYRTGFEAGLKTGLEANSNTNIRIF